MRDHSSDSRCAFCPSDARSAKSSSYRWRWSIASPEDSTAGEAGSCSQSHQSLLWLPPSTWCAAVLLPHRKVLGKLDMAFLSGPARDGWAGAILPPVRAATPAGVRLSAGRARVGCGVVFVAGRARRVG